MTANYPEADHIYPAFAIMLDQMQVEASADRMEDQWLVCQACSASVCTIEDGDSMRTLLNTTLAHKCEPVKPKKNRR